MEGRQGVKNERKGKTLSKGVMEGKVGHVCIASVMFPFHIIAFFLSLRGSNQFTACR